MLNSIGPDQRSEPQFTYELARTHYFLGRTRRHVPHSPPGGGFGRPPREHPSEKHGFPKPPPPPPPREMNFSETSDAVDDWLAGLMKRGVLRPEDFADDSPRDDDYNDPHDGRRPPPRDHGRGGDRRHRGGRDDKHDGRRGDKHDGRRDDRDRPPPHEQFGPPLFAGAPPSPPPYTGDAAELNKAVALLIPLTRTYPARPEFRYLLARCYREMPHEAGAPAGGDSLEKAVEILESLARDYPHSADYRYDLADTYTRFELQGPLFFEETTAAWERLGRAQKIAQQLATEHPHVPDYVSLQVQIHGKAAELLARRQRFDSAEVHLAAAVSLQSSLVQQFPEAASYRLWKAILERALGDVLRREHREDEAYFYLYSSVTELEELRAADADFPNLSALLVDHYGDLADVLREMGEVDAAANAQRRADQLRGDAG